MLKKKNILTLFLATILLINSSLSTFALTFDGNLTDVKPITEASPFKIPDISDMATNLSNSEIVDYVTRENDTIYYAIDGIHYTITKNSSDNVVKFITTKENEMSEIIFNESTNQLFLDDKEISVTATTISPTEYSILQAPEDFIRSNTVEQNVICEQQVRAMTHSALFTVLSFLFSPVMPALAGTAIALIQYAASRNSPTYIVKVKRDIYYEIHYWAYYYDEYYYIDGSKVTSDSYLYWL